MFSLWFADDSAGKPPVPPTPPKPPAPPAQASASGKPPAGTKPVDPEEPELEDEEGVDDSDVVAGVMVGIMPWAISFIVHAVIIVVTIFIAWSVVQVLEEDDEAPLINDIRFTPTPGAMVVKKTQKMEAQSAKRSVSKKQVTSNNPSRTEIPTTDLGRAGGGEASSNPFDGQGEATGQSFSNFYGLPGGNAKRIAFLIDASGSLTDSLPFVLKELDNSIAQMVDEQEFTVIFFQDAGRNRQYIELPPTGWKRATGAAKSEASIWMSQRTAHIVPGHRADPIPAIQRALGMRPDLIYLLSDNITGSGQWEQNQDELVEQIKTLNRAVQGRRVKINTIQFIHPDPLEGIKDASGERMKPTLELIADSSDGKYRFVGKGELGLARD